MSSSPSKVVSTMMRAWGKSMRMRPIASTPFICGRRKSINVMSGWWRRNSSIALRPSDASATMEKSGTVRNSATSPWRTMLWSSTIMIRMRSLILPTFSLLSYQRCFDRNSRTPAGSAFQHQRGVDLLRPLMHTLDTVVALRPAQVWRGLESAAVVGYLEGNPRRLINQLHVDARGCGVAHGIGDRLLANAQQFLFGLARDRAVGPLHLKVHLGRRAAGNPVAALPQPCRQVLRARSLGTQIPDGCAGLGQAGPHQRARLIQLLQGRLA